MFAHVELEHPVEEGELKARSRPYIHREPRAGDLGRSLQVEEP